MTRPTMLITPFGKAVLVFPFNRWLVDALKVEVPVHARSYDPATKRWEVVQPYVNAARNLITYVYPDVEIVDEFSRFTPPPINPPSAPDEYQALHLLPSAPPELIEAAFKCLSKLHHPDRGGDVEKMQALNEAVSIIRRRVAS